MNNDDNKILIQVKKNIKSVQDKLTQKDMHKTFWVIANRTDFKPLRKLETNDKDNNKSIVKSTVKTIKEINEHLLGENGSHYIGKHFANIKVWFDNDLINDLENNSLTKIKNEDIVSVIITIYCINDQGKISNNQNNIWSIKVTFSIDDFINLKFDIKNIESIMRIVSDKIITSNLIGGISYKNLLNKLRKKVLQ